MIKTCFRFFKSPAVVGLCRVRVPQKLLGKKNTPHILFVQKNKEYQGEDGWGVQWSDIKIKGMDFSGHY